MYRSCQARLQDMEAATRAAASERERLVTISSRHTTELEQRERTIAESREQGRQASEMVESGNAKLKAAKEEIRKLMSVLLQREAKYSHEIRRSEQESAKLKERLVKVLMEKGEGRGVGVNVITMTGPVPGPRAGRSHWQTEQSGARREEELFKRVLEQMTKREAAAADINLKVETALNDLSSAVRESLIHLEVDPRDTESIGGDTDTRADILYAQTRDLSKMLKENVFKLQKPSESYLCQEKLALCEEKIALYEQILVNFESSKEKQDWILEELRDLQKLSKESLLKEKCKMQERSEEIDRIKTELELQSENLDKIRSKLIKNHHSMCSSDEPSSQLVLSPAARSGEPGDGLLPSWAVGPLQVTPHSAPSLRQQQSSGLVLGYTGRSASRPGSRPGSQPGSRAQSVNRERMEKGKSPAAHLINKRAGGSRMIDTYTASLGRKARPKSGTISPSRGNTINRRSANLSRSPSRSKEPGPRSSLSLPRHSLTLRGQESSKRHSGAWSKPPTPGPLSPATSDSEQSCQPYRPSILKSSKYSS